jgi:pyrrolidone-carboxylate peptidase
VKLIAGFEPFSTHVVNASWVAVKEMSSTGGLGDDVNLVALELPVCYEKVRSLVPELWNKYQPKV